MALGSDSDVEVMDTVAQPDGTREDHTWSLNDHKSKTSADSCSRARQHAFGSPHNPEDHGGPDGGRWRVIGNGKQQGAPSPRGAWTTPKEMMEKMSEREVERLDSLDQVGVIEGQKGACGPSRRAFPRRRRRSLRGEGHSEMNWRPSASA